MGKKCVCRKCGGSLVIEYIAERGLIYRLKRNGTVGGHVRNVNYEGTGDYMVYCPSCGENYSVNIIGGTFIIEGEEDE